MAGENCGFSEKSLNDFLECCFDESHIVPSGPKVAEADKPGDLKLWDFDPSCCIDLCHSPSSGSIHSSMDSMYQPDMDHHCSNTPCCNRDDGLCDLDEHLKPENLANLDSILSKCVDIPQDDSLIRFENVSDVRDTITHHHHHLLHLHHSDQNDNIHSHDLVLHHHDHHGQDGGHHHHLRFPETAVGGVGGRDFILPNCSKTNVPVLKSDGVSDFITFANGDRKSAAEVVTPVMKQRLKRRLSSMSSEQRFKFFHAHSKAHSHLHTHSDGKCHNHQHTHTNVKKEEDDDLLGPTPPASSYSDSHSHTSLGTNLDSHFNQACKWLDCGGLSSDMSRHVFEKHIEKLDPTGETIYKCEWDNCNFNSTDIEHLYEHVPTHTCPNKHVCKWVTGDVRCTHEFDSTEDLTNHIVQAHVGSGKSKYECNWEGCERNHRPFNQRQKVVRHLNTHTKHQPFQCEVCGKRFSLSLMLKQHMRIHTGETPYECNICGKQFKTSSSLTIHKRVHSGIKPLECKVCGKRFNESSNLNKHMKIHSRKYKCEVCHKSFDDELKYNRHTSCCSK